MEVIRRNKELLIASHLVLKQASTELQVVYEMPSGVGVFPSKLAYIYSFDNTSDFEQLTVTLFARTLAEYQEEMYPSRTDRLSSAGRLEFKFHQGR